MIGILFYSKLSKEKYMGIILDKSEDINNNITNLNNIINIKNTEIKHFINDNIRYSYKLVNNMYTIILSNKDINERHSITLFKIIDNILYEKSKNYSLLEKSYFKRLYKEPITVLLNKYKDIKNVDELEKALGLTDKLIKRAESQKNNLLINSEGIETLTKNSEDIKGKAEIFKKKARELERTIIWDKRKKIAGITLGCAGLLGLIYYF